MSVRLGEDKITDIVSTSEGVGGTNNYNELDNKPQINGVTLQGNLTTADLNIETGTVDAYTKEETQALIKSSITGKADTTYVNNQLDLKADKSTTYTKTEVDNNISSITQNINNKLANKADKSDTYTKEETISAIQSNTTNKADTTYVDTQLNLKADKSDTYTKEEVDNLVDNQTVAGDTLPIGSITPYSGISTPSNWLLCDGREISREVYSQLFAVIGTSYGAGDGSTTFNLPDLTFTGTEVNNYIIKAKQSAGVVATVVDTLESSSATDALSANQGKILNDKINNKGVKLLFNGNITTNGTNIKLSESINNFDLICIVSRNDAGSQSLLRLNTTIIPLALYKAGGTNYNIPASTTSNIILNIDNDTTLNCQDGLNQYFAIMQVYGIKL